MKRATRMLVLAAALTLLLALVATANAKPTTCKGNNPACTTTTTPTATTTTTTTVVPGSLGVGFSCADWFTGETDHPLTWDADENGTLPDKELTLTSRDNDTCIDISGTAAGSFTVEVTSVEPEPKRNSILVAVIKDSHPGDHCGQIGEDDPRSALNLNLTNVDEGTGTIHGTIIDVQAATPNACGTDYTDASDPLAFMLFITGRPGITADITLTYEAYPTS